MSLIQDGIKNEIVFDQNTRKYIQILFWNHGAFHWVYINLNTKFEKIWNNKK